LQATFPLLLLRDAQRTKPAAKMPPSREPELLPRFDVRKTKKYAHIQAYFF